MLEYTSNIKRIGIRYFWVLGNHIDLRRNEGSSIKVG